MYYNRQYHHLLQSKLCFVRFCIYFDAINSSPFFIMFASLYAVFFSQIFKLMKNADRAESESSRQSPKSKVQCSTKKGKQQLENTKTDLRTVHCLYILTLVNEQVKRTNTYRRIQNYLIIWKQGHLISSSSDFTSIHCYC